MGKRRLRREIQAHYRGFLRFRSLVGRRSRKDVEEDKNVQPCTALTGNNLRVSLLPPLKERIQEPFRLISKEERTLVQHAFAPRNSSNLLVSHHISNIDIFGKTLQCLKPTAWLNDEVINLYLELLKERETRDPHRYLKCHFFNTFFYTKLVSDGSPCSYKAVKRWTTHTKLGYQLIHCDIIFVPIHRNRNHWALAVIHIRERKFLYLDSLDSNDFMPILNALANYLVQEVKDKSGKHIDVNSWGFQRVEDRPRQQNGYDCGMFMLKYIDFYSRALDLLFSQKDMPNFRSRTAKEILRLQAN